MKRSAVCLAFLALLLSISASAATIQVGYLNFVNRVDNPHQFYLQVYWYAGTPVPSPAPSELEEPISLMNAKLMLTFGDGIPPLVTTFFSRNPTTPGGYWATAASGTATTLTSSFSAWMTGILTSSDFATAPTGATLSGTLSGEAPAAFRRLSGESGRFWPVDADFEFELALNGWQRSVGLEPNAMSVEGDFVTPEPASLLLVGCALLGLAARRRYNKA